MQKDAKFNLGLDLKGLDAHEDGDLYIEGWAADFDLDDEDEAFEPGAFRKAVEAFTASGNMPLLYHHKGDHPLGEVLALEPRPQGLWMKARVDRPSAGSWAEDVFNKIKRGTIKGLSVGGVFRRRMGADGRPRIHEASLREISISPIPVNQRTLFAVAQKAFGDLEAGPTDEELEWLEEAKAVLERLEGAFDKLGNRVDDTTDNDPPSDD